jgi:hypothetical protein
VASFTVNIPDAQVARLVQAVAKIRGVDISAMTTAQRVAFIKSDLRDYWIDLMRQVEVPAVAQAAADTASATRIADINANLTVS